jgi:hypothetical protein
MQSLLYAIGLGAGAIPLAAALNWIIKDGLGQLGGVIYAAMMSNRFDSDPKRHRFISGLSLQMATFLEIVTPLFPGYFLLLASVSNVGKNISWLAASATRAQIHKTMSSSENLGDITGKAGSQSTAASLLGTALGILVSAISGSSFDHVFLAFAPFSFLTLFSLYLSNNQVVVKTLNSQRSEILFQQYFIQLEANLKQNFAEILENRSYLNHQVIVGTPEEISKHEHFVFPFKSLFSVQLLFEPEIGPVVEALPPLESAIFLKQLSRQNQSNYLICCSKNAVNIWYLKGASHVDILKGLFHANTIRYLLHQGKTTGNLSLNESKYLACITFVDSCFENFYQGLSSQGWTLDHLFIAEDLPHITIERAIK